MQTAPVAFSLDNSAFPSNPAISFTSETASGSKVPQVALAFWIIKIAATTLGETGGDALSMTLNLGYLVSTGIFLLCFIAALAVQVRAKAFHPLSSWAVVVTIATRGTTRSDYADCSVALGYSCG